MYTIKENNIIWNVEGIFSKSKKIDEKELDERIKVLIEEIKQSIKELPDILFRIKYLFYDNF